MALNYTVTLTGGTDNGTYTIYYDQVDPSNIATIYGSSTPATNLTLSQVQNGVIVTIPTGTGLIIFVNDNPNFATDCSTNQVIFNIVPDATPPPTSTPNPTPNPTSTPTETQAPTPNPTQNPTPTPSPSVTPDPTAVELTYKFCQCGGEGTVGSSVSTQNFNTESCIYLTQTQLGGIPSTGDRVLMSDAFCYLYDSQVQGTATTLTINPAGCECDSPTPTPSPSPSPTPVELRDKKFVYCGTVENAALGAETQAGNPSEELEEEGGGEVNPPIYLTSSEYGSTPQLGDTLQINDGGTDNKCYEYDSQEVGSETTGITIVNTSCVCPPDPTPNPTATSVFYRLQGCANNYDYTVPKDAWCENGSLATLSTNYQVGDVLQLVTSCSPNAAPFCGTVVNTNFTAPSTAGDAYISRTIPANGCDDMLRCNQ